MMLARIHGRRANKVGREPEGRRARTVSWPLHRAHGVHYSWHVLGCRTDAWKFPTAFLEGFSFHPDTRQTRHAIFPVAGGMMPHHEPPFPPRYAHIAPGEPGPLSDCVWLAK